MNDHHLKDTPCKILLAKKKVIPTRKSNRSSKKSKMRSYVPQEGHHQSTSKNQKPTSSLPCTPSNKLQSTALNNRLKSHRLKIINRPQEGLLLTLSRRGRRTQRKRLRRLNKTTPHRDPERTQLITGKPILQTSKLSKRRRSWDL